MTCIVGLKHNNKIYIGADSAGVYCNTLSVNKRKDPKVFIKKTKTSSMIFGFTSSFRMGQILNYSLKIPVQKQNQSDMHFLVNSFIDAVKNCFIDGGYGKIHYKDKHDREDEGGTFLLGYKNNLYMVESDFQIAQLYNDYDACGCGKDLALGSMFSTKDKPPKERIQMALEAAAEFSAGVSAPFNILNI